MSWSFTLVALVALTFVPASSAQFRSLAGAGRGPVYTRTAITLRATVINATPVTQALTCSWNGQRVVIPAGRSATVTAPANRYPQLTFNNARYAIQGRTYRISQHGRNYVFR
jgi:hypothetical protein